MILCLDVGNTQIYAGVYSDEKLLLQFRKTSKTASSSDEIGLFLKNVLRENSIDPDKIHHISICTVVPEVLHSLKNACKKYFNINPFVLQAGVKTGLKIKYRNPLEVGADRIANSIAASHLFPNKNIIIVDFGTATTFCALNKDNEYLGGIIMAGLKLSMKSLEQSTSKLPSVEIVVPKNSVGRSTVESIQSGLYWGTVGTIKELKSRIEKESFNGEPALLIGTGGLAGLFNKAKIFDHEVSDLVHKGLLLSLKMNT